MLHLYVKLSQKSLCVYRVVYRTKGKKEKGKDTSCNVVGKHNDTKSLLTLMAAATCESRLSSRV